MGSPNGFARKRLVVAGCLLLAPSFAGADISVRAWVRLITAGQCQVQRTIDSNGHSQVVYEALDCTVHPEQSTDSYYFETRLEGNLIEQIVDAAQFSKALYDLASDVDVAVGSGGTAAALSGARAANDLRTAYREFDQLLDGWGGKWENTQDDFVVTSPTGSASPSARATARRPARGSRRS